MNRPIGYAFPRKCYQMLEHLHLLLDRTELLVFSLRVISTQAETNMKVLLVRALHLV